MNRSTRRCLLLLALVLALTCIARTARAQGDADLNTLFPKDAPTSEQVADADEAPTNDDGPESESADLDEQPPKVVAGLVDALPEDWSNEWFGLLFYQWIALGVVLVLGIVADVLVRYGLNVLTIGWRRYVAGDENALAIERKAWKPMGWLAMAVVWYVGTVVIGLPQEVLAVLKVILHVFATGMGVWTAFLLIDFLASVIKKKAAQTETKFDDLLAPLVSRSLKALTVCIGAVTLAQAVGWPLAGLISGMGIGGLAVAFAAKDTIGNLFGSVTVLVDRPFEIGDWIITNNVEGSVEMVGMRSTRIRTFYNSVITVPNNLLTTAVVDNMGKRSYRRFKTMIGVQYDTTPEQIEAFTEGIREILRRHPYTRKDYYHVYLNGFGASSLDILLYCFFECPDWSIELRERQRLMLDILRLAAALGVEFAFPTQTLHVHTQEPADTQSPIGSPLEEGRRQAARIAGRPVPSHERPGAVEFGDWRPIGGVDEESSDNASADGASE